ncbi:MAG: hypothetical protein ACMZ7B_04515 [Balneola sp.]
MKAFFLTIFLVITFSITSYACSCGEWDFDDLDEVFLGKIVNVYEASSFLEDYGDSVYVFEVLKKWKGGKSDRLKVYDIYSCGYSSDIWNSKEVIVYAINYSTIAELLYSDFIDDKMFKKISSLGYRKATTACFYSLHSFKLDSASGKYLRIPVEEEISMLDSTFTEPVTLRPYYLNFTNLFLLIGVILVGVFVGNKNQNKKPS